jgi:hypothetical protein
MSDNENNRKIIFKARVGSHLHGTSTPTSDEDFLGVFMPSAEDLLGVQNRPSEWTMNEKKSDGPRNSAGDVDCKLLSIQRFFEEAAQGQSQALELLFIPKEHVLVSTPEWEEILANKDLFLSRKGIRPIIGFAVAQVHKATVKGENLTQIRELIAECERREGEGLGRTSIRDHVEGGSIWNVPVQIHTNEHGFEMARIANRDYDLGTDVKRFRESLVFLEKKYGSRTREAAKNTFDFKSLSHAFRLIGEAEEFITTGSITFPRPDAAFLLQVKQGVYEGDFGEEIKRRLDHLDATLIPGSPLSAEPKYAEINDLCISMLKKNFFLRFFLDSQARA